MMCFLQVILFKKKKTNNLGYQRKLPITYLFHGSWGRKLGSAVSKESCKQIHSEKRISSKVGNKGKQGFIIKSYIEPILAGSMNQMLHI